jgi:hypothetical protein
VAQRTAAVMESRPKLTDRDNGPVQTMFQGRPKGPTYLGEQEHSPSTTWEQGGLETRLITYLSYLLGVDYLSPLPTDDDRSGLGRFAAQRTFHPVLRSRSVRIQHLGPRASLASGFCSLLLLSSTHAHTDAHRRGRICA